MPIVFVHGVNTRNTDPGYAARLQVITKFIQAHFAGVIIGGSSLGSLTPRFPYWGDLATQFRWDMASLPSGRINSLGANVSGDLRPTIGALADGLRDPNKATQPILATARELGLDHAVEVLGDTLILHSTAADAERIAEFVVSTQRYAAANLQPPWLAGLRTDSQFLDALVTEVQAGSPPAAGIDALGAAGAIQAPVAVAGSRIKQAMLAAKGALLSRTGDFASTKFLAWQREPLNAILGRFFGDVFAYLHDRGDKAANGLIPTRILTEFDAAVAALPNEPLVIIGHSLGGVITYDLLSHFRPDIKVDLLITVGSQVSHFEEMKRFLASDPAIGAPKKAKTATNIGHWINVFDEVDIFAYACDKIFDRVQDFGYDTRTYITKAHSAYFDQDRFYSRLRQRIDALP